MLKKSLQKSFFFEKFFRHSFFSPDFNPSWERTQKISTINKNFSQQNSKKKDSKKKILRVNASLRKHVVLMEMKNRVASNFFHSVQRSATIFWKVCMKVHGVRSSATDSDEEKNRNFHLK